MDQDAGRCLSAYLYTLGIDPTEIAWEWLRRNDEYAEDWARRGNGADPRRWGLAAFENPDFDARQADPLWLDTKPDLVIVPSPSMIAGPAFDLWALPAPRRLLHDGQHLHATLGGFGSALRLMLAATISQGRPYAYLVPAGAAARTRRRQAAATIDAAEGPRHRAALRAAQRDAMVAMRTFVAFDAQRAGASQRQIAVSLFGCEQVRRSWSADSELRAQVRHLLARGRKLVRGGYRALVGSPGDSSNLA